MPEVKGYTREMMEQELGKRQAEDDDLDFVSRKKLRVSGDLGRCDLSLLF